MFILKASRVAVLQAAEGRIAHAAKLALEFFLAARTWVGRPDFLPGRRRIPVGLVAFVVVGVGAAERIVLSGSRGDREQ